MAVKAKPSKTPSRIMMGMVKAEMARLDINPIQLSKKAKCCSNTVRRDLKEPDTTPQGRLWLYFSILGLPIEKVLKAVASECALHAAEGMEEMK